MEEQQEGNDAESQRKEIELLKQESTLPLDQLLSTLTFPQVMRQLQQATFFNSVYLHFSSSFVCARHMHTMNHAYYAGLCI